MGHHPVDLFCMCTAMQCQHSVIIIITIVVDIRVDMLAALLKEHQELVYRYIVSSGKS